MPPPLHWVPGLEEAAWVLGTAPVSPAVTLPESALSREFLAEWQDVAVR